MLIATGYEARAPFVPLHARTKRWGVVVAHRRAGKTVACINDLIDAALTCGKPDPRFAYVAPTFTQAKDVAWLYLKRYTQAIPGTTVNESELRVDLPGGRRIRLYGCENYDRMRGLYFDGLICDEFGDMDPQAWTDVMRPALSDRKGWAVFIGTPKGRNHFSDLWDKAQLDDDWFALMLRASQSGLLDPAELADAKKMMTEEAYAAEYECSFQAGIVGAYYGREMQAAEAEKRIAPVPWEPKFPVHIAWDLGIGDSTVIWFCQRVGREWHLIDYVENSGVGLDWYAKELDRRPYTYGEALLPHDAEPKELGTGKSLKETLEALGLRRIRIIPAQSVADGINAARLMLPQCWFDAQKCERGLNALRNYRKEWDEKRKVFHDRPRHDWASHAADAFRYLALGDPKGNDVAFTKPFAWGKTPGGMSEYV